MIKFQKRFISLFEFQALELLKKAGVPVPKTLVVEKLGELTNFLKEASVPFILHIDFKEILLKAQVQTGGRGKGIFKNSKVHGVEFANSIENAVEKFKKMIDNYLVTEQTNSVGLKCERVF